MSDAETAFIVRLIPILLVAWVVLMIPAYLYSQKRISGKAAITMVIVCAIGSTAIYFASQ